MELTTYFSEKAVLLLMEFLMVLLTEVLSIEPQLEKTVKKMMDNNRVEYFLISTKN